MNGNSKAFIFSAATMLTQTVFIGLLLASAVHASNYTGTIARVVAQPSPTTPSTQTRISIFTGSVITTACASPNLYSFDSSNPGLVSTYNAILLTALAANMQVTIGGSGVCDAYNIEEVASIYLNGIPI
jgi:hypothetical protein